MAGRPAVTALRAVRIAADTEPPESGTFLSPCSLIFVGALA